MFFKLVHEEKEKWHNATFTFLLLNDSIKKPIIFFLNFPLKSQNLEPSIFCIGVAETKEQDILGYFVCLISKFITMLEWCPKILIFMCILYNWLSTVIYFIIVIIFPWDWLFVWNERGWGEYKVVAVKWIEVVLVRKIHNNVLKFETKIAKLKISFDF